MKLKGSCMFVNSENSNGIYYPEEVVKNVISNYDVDHRQFGNTSMMGCESRFEVNVDLITHKTSKAEFKDGKVDVLLEVVEHSEYSKEIAKLIREAKNVSVNPVMITTPVDEDGIKQLGPDTKVLRFDITLGAGFVEKNRLTIVED